VRSPLRVLPAVILAAGVYFLVMVPFLGNKSLLLSTACFFLGLAMVLLEIPANRRRPAAEARRRMYRLVVLLVVASLGTALAGGQLAIVLATRVTITPDAEACARFAAISPSQAVDRVALAQRFDMFEVRTTVTPTAVNETGWEFEVGCASAPSLGESRGVRLGWATDGHPRFLWLVSYGDDWGLLGGMTWVDWDTGELLPP